MIQILLLVARWTASSAMSFQIYFVQVLEGSDITWHVSILTGIFAYDMLLLNLARLSYTGRRHRDTAVRSDP